MYFYDGKEERIDFMFLVYYFDYAYDVEAIESVDYSDDYFSFPNGAVEIGTYCTTITQASSRYYTIRIKKIYDLVDPVVKITNSNFSHNTVDFNTTDSDFELETSITGDTTRRRRLINAQRRLKDSLDESYEFDWMGVLRIENSSTEDNYAYMGGGVSVSMEYQQNQSVKFLIV